MISVIVPIYNVEAYLRYCLDSIVKQTYRDIEIILVDDGSTDISGEICDEFAAIDNRISVIHQKNAGALEARNTGLRVAHGDYIWIPDADDYMHPRMLEILYDAISSGDHDLSMCYGVKVCNQNYFNNTSTNESSYHSPTKGIEINRDKLIVNLWKLSQKEIQYQVVWNKLYKRSLLQDIFFINTASHDTEFNNRVYQKVKTAILLPISLYCWVQRPKSITHQGINKRFIGIADSFFYCLDNLPKDVPLARSYCMQKMYNSLLHNGLAKGTEYEQLADDTYKRIKKETFREFIRDIHIPIYRKAYILFFLSFPSLYRIFIKMIGCMVNLLHKIV